MPQGHIAVELLNSLAPLHLIEEVLVPNGVELKAIEIVTKSFILEKDACRGPMHEEDLLDDLIFLLDCLSCFWHSEPVFLETTPKFGVPLSETVDSFESCRCSTGYLTIICETFSADLSRHEVICRSDGEVMVERERVCLWRHYRLVRPPSSERSAYLSYQPRSVKGLGYSTLLPSRVLVRSRGQS